LEGDEDVFVWVFHRLSGVVLIVLLSLQLVTGFLQSSPSQSEWVKSVALLHRHTPVVCLTVFLLIFHALYGVRTILLDLGIGRERWLLWGCNILGVVLFGVFAVLYVTLVRA
jgi:succinate dehydrogenase/fumarate reductase cytochrome b subunit